MPIAAVRLVLGVALLPFLFGFWCISFVALDDLVSLGNDAALAGAFVVSAACGAGIWILLWARSIRWNPRRTASTASLTLLLLLIAAGAPFLPASPEPLDTIRIVGPVIAFGIWMALMAWSWREAAGPDQVRENLERALRCPACGYSLIGLREARCPECGQQYTLDELMTAIQPACMSGATNTK